MPIGKSDLKVGVIGSSRLENEKRIPIHPSHLGRIPECLRGNIRFENSYGSGFGVVEGELEAYGFEIGSRDELLATSDVIVLPKSCEADLREAKPGACLWGWMHAVQQHAIAQAAIDQRLTLITWEAMHYRFSGSRPVHVFHRNNELAGYCSVLHAFALKGISGVFGPSKSAVVIGFGSTARGAIAGLWACGVTDISVISRRTPEQIPDRITSVSYLQMQVEDGCEVIEEDGSCMPAENFLAGFDIVVNCVLQDPECPIMFVGQRFAELAPYGTMVVDVSCDRGMGFPFALPTSFEEPVISCGNVWYYAVDHTPTYLWDAASWEISRAVLPHLPDIVAGQNAWHGNAVLGPAIEIENGFIKNSKVLAFQRRGAVYPHRADA